MYTCIIYSSDKVGKSNTYSFTSLDPPIFLVGPPVFFFHVPHSTHAHTHTNTHTHSSCYVTVMLPAGVCNMYIVDVYTTDLLLFQHGPHLFFEVVYLIANILD